MPTRSVLFAVRVSVALDACAPALSQSPTTAPSTAAATSAQPAAGGGGALVVAVTADPGHLTRRSRVGGRQGTSNLLYNGLVGLGPNLKPIPELAESWEVEGDGPVYRFKLRQGGTLHDGYT